MERKTTKKIDLQVEKKRNLVEIMKEGYNVE